MRFDHRHQDAHQFGHEGRKAHCSEYFRRNHVFMYYKAIPMKKNIFHHSDHAGHNIRHHYGGGFPVTAGAAPYKSPQQTVHLEQNQYPRIASYIPDHIEKTVPEYKQDDFDPVDQRVFTVNNQVSD